MIFQFRDYSFNQFNLEAFLRETSKDKTISNDAWEIHIDVTVTGKLTGLVQDIVLSEVEMIISNLRTQINFVIIFLSLRNNTIRDRSIEGICLS